MKRFYDESDYYDRKKNNQAGSSSRFNAITLKNVFGIYWPEKGEKILDLGCGWGNISLALAKAGFAVTGLDYSAKSTGICRQAAAAQGLKNTKFIQADAADTGLDAAAFDVVYCADLVEHLYPRVYEDMLKEVHRLLKKSGKFIIYTPNPGHIFELMKNRNIILRKDISHVDYKSMERLKKDLPKQGFSVEKACYIESHFPIINIIEKIFMPFLPLLRRRNAVLAIKK